MVADTQIENKTQRSNLPNISLRCWGNAGLDPVDPTGLGDLSVDLQPQKLDFFLSKMELNDLVMDEALGMLYLSEHHLPAECQGMPG